MLRCVPLCGLGALRSGGVPTEPVKSAVTTEIEARPEETPQILLSADTPAPEAEAVAESDPQVTEITAEEKTEPTPHTVSKSTPAFAVPKPGDRAVIDGKPHIWIPGFGWIVDEGGSSVGTTVGNLGDELTGNKVGQMSGATVSSDGDINKQVGIMGGGTVAEDMYENGHKIGIMGVDESTPHETVTPPMEQVEITGDVIYIELQPPVTKNSTLPSYRPNGDLANP